MAKNSSMASKILKLKKEDSKIRFELNCTRIVADDLRNGTIGSYDFSARRNYYYNPYAKERK